VDSKLIITDEEYAKQLQKLYNAIISTDADTLSTLIQLENILFYLYTNYNQRRVDQLAEIGEKSLEGIEVQKLIIAQDILKVIEELPEIQFSPEYNTNVGSLLQLVRDIIASQKHSAA